MSTLSRFMYLNIIYLLCNMLKAKSDDFVRAGCHVLHLTDYVRLGIILTVERFTYFF